MNKRYIVVILSIVLLMTRCKKDTTVADPVFDVTTASLTYKVNQQVTFKISGNPHLLTFWSGERTHVYANRNRVSEKGTAQYMSFTSLLGVGTQSNNISLQASNDFTGNYTPDGVAKATWTDITSRAVLSTGTSVSSGNVNLADFTTATDSKPLYLAIKYTSPQNTLKPRQWTFTNLAVTNLLADGTNNAVGGNFVAANVKAVDVANPNYVWNVGTGIIFPSANIGDAPNEDWAIVGPFNLNAVLSSDFANTTSGLAKGESDAPVTEFNYLFTTAGTYVVTFVGTNANKNDTKTITKEFKITITP